MPYCTSATYTLRTWQPNDNDYQQFYYFGRNEYQGRDYIFMQYLWNFPMKVISTANKTINTINPETANAEGLGWLGTAHALPRHVLPGYGPRL